MGLHHHFPCNSLSLSLSLSLCVCVCVRCCLPRPRLLFFSKKNRHLSSNCEFPNPVAPPEELAQLALEEESVDGGATAAAAAAATAENNMSRTGNADVFLTAYSDSDEDGDGDGDDYGPSAHATPRLMVVNGAYSYTAPRSTVWCTEANPTTLLPVTSSSPLLSPPSPFSSLYRPSRY